MRVLFVFDKIVGWPFLLVLRGLHRFTGFSNLQLAQAAIVAGIMCFFSSLFSDLRENLSSLIFWGFTILISILMALATHSLIKFIDVLLDGPLAGASAFVVCLRLVAFVRMLGSIPSAIIVHNDATILNLLAYLLLTAGLYFLTDTCRRRKSWVTEIIGRLAGHGGPQASEASMTKAKYERADRR